MEQKTFVFITARPHTQLFNQKWKIKSQHAYIDYIDLHMYVCVMCVHAHAIAGDQAAPLIALAWGAAMAAGGLA